MTEKKTGGGGPPMVFSMPMFYDWIPRSIRPWLYIVLAFCF